MAPAKADERVTNFQQNMNRQAVCVGCGSLIQDQFILKVAPDMEWHASCLKCSECNQYLDESCTCFVRDGRTYCKRDYIRLFASKCSKCHQGFVKSDFVMRAKTDMYHMECFSCVACNRQLIPGDEFAVKDSRLLCRDDSCALLEDVFPHKKMEPEPFPCKPDSDSRSQCDKDDDIDEGCNSGDEMDDIETITSGRSERSGNNKSGSGRQTNKPTRVRTVLTEKQLHTLRACYGANPRPDALMKEQLVEMTGLPPRVIRVWFQNKRCKDKKRSILMSKLQDKQHTNRMGQTLQGIPMVATSPVRHESPTHLNPIEVHSYQTPWKGMDSYMHNDMAHPPAFQQLIHSFDKDPELYSSPESDTYSYMTLGSCSENLSPNPPGSVSSGFSGSPLDLSPISQ